PEGVAGPSEAAEGRTALQRPPRTRLRGRSWHLRDVRRLRKGDSAVPQDAQPGGARGGGRALADRVHGGGVLHLPPGAVVSRARQEGGGPGGAQDDDPGGVRRAEPEVAGAAGPEAAGAAGDGQLARPGPGWPGPGRAPDTAARALRPGRVVAGLHA